MPLYKTLKPNKKTIVLVWKISESLSELESIFTNKNSENRLAAMQSKMHRKGFLSVRHLLKVAGYTDDDLFYTDDGKPHLKDGKRISITHSFNFSAIIISNEVVGIDIEKNREKIIKIAPKFLGKELEYIDSDLRAFHNTEAPFFIKTEESKTELIKRLTMIWGGKESLYKIHPDGGLLFKKHLEIEKFYAFNKKSKGWIKKEHCYEIYDIYFENFEGFSLVYAMS